MFSFKDSFKFIFKEKNSFLKLFIPLSTVTVYYILTFSIESLGKASEESAAALVMLCLLCVYIFVLITYLFITLWNTYEVMQAAIYERETKLVWQYSMLESLKRVGSYMLLSLILSLPILISLFGIVIIGIGFYIVSEILGIMFVLFTLLIWLLLIVVYSQIFVIPSTLRLAATNSISQALEFKTNLNIGTKYWKEFAKIFLIAFGITFCLGFIVGFVDVFFTLAFPSDLEWLAVIITGVITLPLNIFVFFLSLFVLSNVYGTLYKNIMIKEGVQLPLTK